MMTFGSELRRLRESKGWTNRALAIRLAKAYPKSKQGSFERQINRWEKDEYHPAPSQIRIIAGILGVTPGALIELARQRLLKCWRES